MADVPGADVAGAGMTGNEFAENAAAHKFKTSTAQLSHG